MRQVYVSPSVALRGCVSLFCGWLVNSSCRGLLDSHPGKGTPGLCDVDSGSFLHSGASCLAPHLHSYQQGGLDDLIFGPVTLPSLHRMMAAFPSSLGLSCLTEPGFIRDTKAKVQLSDRALVLLVYSFGILLQKLIKFLLPPTYSLKMLLHTHTHLDTCMHIHTHARPNYFLIFIIMNLA